MYTVAAKILNTFWFWMVECFWFVNRTIQTPNFVSLDFLINKKIIYF